MEYRENDRDGQLISRPVDAGIQAADGHKPARLCKQYPLATGSIIIETDGGFGFIGCALGWFSIGNAFWQGI